LILLSFDTETTGLDPLQDRVIEVGAVLYSTGQKRCLESSGYLVKSDVPITEHITELTGITQTAVDKFGYDSKTALEALLDLINLCDAVVGQNIIQFDKEFLKGWTKRENVSFPNKLWVDTLTDLPNTEGKHLSYMACDAGFINLFPHSALADAQTVIKLISMHDIDAVIERAKNPTIAILAHQKREDNFLAKQRKFKWNSHYKVWWRIVKDMDKAEIIRSSPFDISVAPPEILISELRYGN